MVSSMLSSSVSWAQVAAKPPVSPVTRSGVPATAASQAAAAAPAPTAGQNAAPARPPATGTGSATNTQTGVTRGGSTAPANETRPATRPNANPTSGTQSSTGTGSSTRTQTSTQSQTNTGTQSSAQTGVTRGGSTAPANDPRSGTRPNPNPNSGTQSSTGTGSSTRTQTGTQTGTQTQTRTGTSTRTSTGTNTGTGSSSSGGNSGGGQTQTPTPTPTPTPDPYIEKARTEARADGSQDGIREARARASAEGLQDGRNIGFQQGFDRCSREEAERAYNAGVQVGIRDGSARGDQEGEARGEAEGAQRGVAEGQADGLARAKADATKTAGPIGTKDGQAQGDQTDASQRGEADGLAKGDLDALTRADTVDYQQARKTFRERRFGEEPARRDAFSNRADVAKTSNTNETPKADLSAAAIQKGLEAFMAADQFSIQVAPDRRFYNPRRTYPTEAAMRVYLDEYARAYPSGFQTEYGPIFMRAREDGIRNGIQTGCVDARRRDYQQSFDEGYRVAFTQSYDAAFKQNYDRSFQRAHSREFGPASQQSYQSSYDGFYREAYEAARVSAYNSRVAALYQAAFSRAHDSKFAQVYPGYQQAAVKRAERDEQLEFEANPLRLIDAQVVESNGNGLVEPNETLRAKIVLRNFSEKALAGQSIRARIRALDSTQAVIASSDEPLAKDLRDLSLTTVSNILELIVNESAVGKVVRLEVEVLRDGKSIGTKSIDLRPQFMVSTLIAEAPVLREGMPAKIKVRVRNESLSDAQAVRARIAVDPNLITISQGEVIVNGLRAGEARDVEFTVIARTPSNSIDLPIVVSAIDGSGRRVGVNDLSRRVAVENDYRITVSSKVDTLRSAGLTRAIYNLKNVSSRIDFKSIQLTVRLVDDQGQLLSGFAIVGPNPQLLRPMVKGEQIRFVVPIMSAGRNDGGKLELEVREDGRLVVVHQLKF